MRLEESFEVAATVDEAWMLLSDVPRVVPCMPGAELIETVDANTWRGLVHVKLGPIALQFDTEVVREEEDESSHRVVLATKARESHGRGNAQAKIESRLNESGRRTRVDIVTDLNLQGSVAQYGRGIVPGVAAQLTRQFAENIAVLLEQEELFQEANPVEPVAPIGGFTLGLRALWSRLARLFRRS